MTVDKILLKNIASLFGIQGASYLLPLITLPYLVRTLGPAAYGELGFALACIQYFVLLTDYGFNLSATQEVAIKRGNKNEISRIFWSVFFCKVLLASAGFIILIVLILCIPFVGNLASILLSGYLLAIGNILLPIWLFQGMERMGWFAICNIGARLISIPLIFWWVKTAQDAWLAAALQGGANVLAGAIGLYFVYRENWITTYKITQKDLKQQLTHGWHVFISTGAISLYTTSITVVLGFIAGPIAVGYFVAADKIRQAAQGLIGPLSQAVYPRVNSLMAHDTAAGFILVRRLLKIQGISTALLSIILIALAPWIITLAYGSTYNPAITVLRLLSPLPFIIGLNNIFGIQVMLPCGYKRAFSQVLIISGVINITLLIPLTWLFKENGAALSILITESFVTCAMAWVLHRKKSPLFYRIAIV